MPTTARRKTSLSRGAHALDQAREPGITVSAVAGDALRVAVQQARRQHWLEETRTGFAAQAEWHAQNGHPLADIIAPHPVPRHRSPEPP